MITVNHISTQSHTAGMLTEDLLEAQLLHLRKMMNGH